MRRTCADHALTMRRPCADHVRQDAITTGSRSLGLSSNDCITYGGNGKSMRQFFDSARCLLTFVYFLLCCWCVGQVLAFNFMFLLLCWCVGVVDVRETCYPRWSACPAYGILVAHNSVYVRAA